MSKKRRHRCYFLFFLISLTFTLIIVIITKQQVIIPLPQHVQEERTPSPSPLRLAHKIIHLDFKGAPPNLAYLTKLLPLFRSAGATGLLLEYEDMFPYQLKNISNKHPYSKLELSAFLTMATSLNFEIIPLIQTFGHLEFVLKLEEFTNLRESPQHPQEICPKNPTAQRVISEMLLEIINFHRKYNVKYIHIGCDEVFHIGLCSKCKNEHPLDLFLNRVKQVAIEMEAFGLRAIIWDDMLRKVGDVEVLRKSGVGSHVDLMVWDYTEDVDHLIQPFLWPMYTTVFENIWVASAYKGAFGESLYRVDVKRHARNQISWLQVLDRESKLIRNLRGIALTGWSRYDHFSVLCELFPPSVPSLVLSLAILSSNEDDEESSLKTALKTTATILNCSKQPTDPFTTLQSFDPLSCYYPGSDLSPELDSLYYAELSWKELKSEWSNSGKGWLTDWNIKHNSSSYWRLEEVKIRCIEIRSSLTTLEINLRGILRRYYSKEIVDEWVEQRLGWILEEVRVMMGRIQALGGVKFWGRRG